MVIGANKKIKKEGVVYKREPEPDKGMNLIIKVERKMIVEKNLGDRELYRKV